ncbi:MAG: hypothetical protein M1828_006367 [Chrysothrix sp. TS-e1954]|nr:MAG: hypothetical protein M1828_006367 [Chrysothrix sp. TS-e1954]
MSSPYTQEIMARMMTGVPLDTNLNDQAQRGIRMPSYDEIMPEQADLEVVMMRLHHAINHDCSGPDITGNIYTCGLAYHLLDPGVAGPVLSRFALSLLASIDPFHGRPGQGYLTSAQGPSQAGGDNSNLGGGGGCGGPGSGLSFGGAPGGGNRIVGHAKKATAHNDVKEANIEMGTDVRTTVGDA